MSSEVHKYIEDRLEKNANLFNAEVINFPNDVKVDSVKISKAKIRSWKPLSSGTRPALVRLKILAFYHPKHYFLSGRWCHFVM